MRNLCKVDNIPMLIRVNSFIVMKKVIEKKLFIRFRVAIVVKCEIANKRIWCYLFLASIKHKKKDLSKSRKNFNVKPCISLH